MISEHAVYQEFALFSSNDYILNHMSSTLKAAKAMEGMTSD
jgi:hypothetical protein